MVGCPDSFLSPLITRTVGCSVGDSSLMHPSLVLLVGKKTCLSQGHTLSWGISCAKSCCYGGIKSQLLCPSLGQL